MPYRQPAPRKIMQTTRKLDEKEVKQAILDFLFERGIVPDTVGLNSIFVRVHSYDSGSRYEAHVTYNEQVLSVSDS